MEIDLLDVGKRVYGDCVLVRQGKQSILIDGAHPGEEDMTLILDQLDKLLDDGPPFVIDLLVVTHCHEDHIGCLPALIGEGDLEVKNALVADEKLGWGRDADGRSPIDSLKLSRSQKMLVAALQEENRADSSQADLEQFFKESENLERDYIQMLEQLEQRGIRVIRFDQSRADMIQELEADFADFGLKIIGPTREQLKKCAEEIAEGTRAIAMRVSEFGRSSEVDISSLARLYQGLARQIAEDPEFADLAAPGPPRNNQSITLRVSAGGWSALLAGDMQFADAQMPILKEDMMKLREEVIDAGPYDFIKLTHHTSDNAVDEGVLHEWSNTKLFAHSGGRCDDNHPAGKALDWLKNREDPLEFARTDRNGLIHVTKNGTVTMTPSRGRLNDFTDNEEHDDPECKGLV